MGRDEWERGKWERRHWKKVFIIARKKLKKDYPVNINISRDTRDVKFEDIFPK
jgi:hypothetical protein